MSIRLCLYFLYMRATNSLVFYLGLGVIALTFTHYNFELDYKDKLELK